MSGDVPPWLWEHPSVSSLSWQRRPGAPTLVMGSLVSGSGGSSCLLGAGRGRGRWGVVVAGRVTVGGKDAGWGCTATEPLVYFKVAIPPTISSYKSP